MSGTFEWVRDALKQRGYRAKDLARGWGISESSTSRWFSGEEQPDLPLSRAATLARMLGIPIDELAKGLGFSGKQVTPQVSPQQFTGAPHSINFQLLDDGNVRLTLCRDTDPDTAMQIIKMLGASAKPLPADHRA
jgi:transcriptional regulator with XRE-family HTH domain